MDTNWEFSAFKKKYHEAHEDFIFFVHFVVKNRALETRFAVLPRGRD